MTPQEKAKELRSIFYKIVDYNSGDTVAAKNADELAVQCVNEIVGILNNLDVDFRMDQLMQMQNIVDYWQQVKDDIV